MQSTAKPHKSAAYESTHLSAKYDYLHPKNPYFQHPIDFFELYKQYHEELSPFFTVKDYAKKKVTFNFKDPHALRALTKVLLRKDFGITLPRPIPEDYLCPPLPNRLNYLCWLDDLTQSTASLTEDITDQFGTSRPLIADIGTGVIGIYALLGAIVFRLRFIASDIDSSSLTFLQEILQHNPHLAESIHPAKVPDSNVLQHVIKEELLGAKNFIGLRETIVANAADPNTWGPVRQLFQHANIERLQYRLMDANYQCASSASSSMGHAKRSNDMDDEDRGSFATKKKRSDEDSNYPTNSTNNVTATMPSAPIKFKTLVSAIMTNPPFYDWNEAVQSNEETVCSGNTTEMHTQGGEVAFVTAIILDSLVLRESVLWYTAMVGKKASLKTLREVLQAYGIPRNHIFETSFIQGVTNRWAIAWTFSSDAAALFQTYTLLNATKATDRTTVVSTTTSAAPDSDASLPPTPHDPTATATLHQESVRLVTFMSAVFQSTMLQAEKLAPYPTEMTQQWNNTPSSSQSTTTAMMFLGRCLQRLVSCIEQLGTHLSQQHFQGFESITFMTPLGHINSVQWNVHVSHEIRYLPHLCEVHCRLSILTTGAEAIPSSSSSSSLSSSVSLHSVKTEALKPLIDLRFTVCPASSASTTSKASMDIDQDDNQCGEGEEDVHIAVTMQLASSYCAAGLASKLVQRSKDFLEPELERTNRRWRRALQRDVDGGGANAARSDATSVEA